MTLNREANKEVRVDYVTVDGTAVAGRDYEPKSGTLVFGRRDLTKTVTIAAGQSAQTFTIAATSFQHFAPGATVEGGTLTAAVQAGTGYALGTHASVDVAIVVGLTVVFEMASYSVAEEAGTLEVKLVALTGAGALTPDTDATSSFYTVELDPLEAQIVHDYESVSATVTFAPSDFSAYGSVFKAEKTVSVTIVDNTMDEQDERFALLLDITPGLLREYQNFVDTDGASCQDTLLCPALVTIADEVASHDLGTDDSVEDLQLAIGENTITVTAADGNTTVTYTLVVTRAAPPPPAHCETGDIWCATLTVAALPDDGVGYSGAQGTLSHVAFEHGPIYLVEALYFSTASGVGTPLRIDFHPSGQAVFNTDDFFLYFGGTDVEGTPRSPTRISNGPTAA